MNKTSDPQFDINLAAMRAAGSNSAQIHVDPVPPTLAEVREWQQAKNAGSFQHTLEIGTETISSISWERKVDHDLFSRWIAARARKGRG